MPTSSRALQTRGASGGGGLKEAWVSAGSNPCCREVTWSHVVTGLNSLVVYLTIPGLPVLPAGCEAQSASVLRR